MIRKLLQSPIITILVILVIGYIAFGFWGKYNRLELKTKEMSALQEKNLEFPTGLDNNFKYSDQYLEQQARIKLNYKDPDEKVVYVYQNAEIDVSQNSLTSQTLVDFREKSNFQLWFEYVIGR